jgi:hypothetical protein
LTMMRRLINWMPSSFSLLTMRTRQSWGWQVYCTVQLRTRSALTGIRWRGHLSGSVLFRPI